MAEKFVDLFALLQGRIDMDWVSKASFGPNFFVNVGAVYAAYSAAPTENTGGPTLQLRTAAGNYAFGMLSMEDAEVAAKIVVGAIQVGLDGNMEDIEGVMRRVVKEVQEQEDDRHTEPHPQRGSAEPV